MGQPGYFPPNISQFPMLLHESLLQKSPKYRQTIWKKYSWKTFMKTCFTQPIVHTRFLEITSSLTIPSSIYLHRYYWQFMAASEHHRISQRDNCCSTVYIPKWQWWLSAKQSLRLLDFALFSVSCVIEVRVNHIFQHNIPHGYDLKIRKIGMYKKVMQ